MANPFFIDETHDYSEHLTANTIIMMGCIVSEMTEKSMLIAIIK